MLCSYSVSIDYNLPQLFRNVRSTCKATCMRLCTYKGCQKCSVSINQSINQYSFNKNLCSQDGRTICGPLRVPKSTYVMLAHKRNPKFFYFGCALVRRCKCKQSTSAHGTDGQTDRQTDGQSATQYAAPS